MIKLAIRSYCWDDWGGSEELWAKSIPYLQEKGFKFQILKPKINRRHPEYVKLAGLGVSLRDLKPTRLIEKIGIQGNVKLNEWFIKFKLPFAQDALIKTPFVNAIKDFNPNLVVIAQGINFDGLKDAYACAVLKIPYVVIAQKAVDFFWPPEELRDLMIYALQNAKKCFFVSNHNKRITEEQFGIRLPNAEVVFNPTKISRRVLDYPSTDKGYRLACVARLFVIDKGQDILLRIFSKEKWKNRPVTVSLIGGGQDTVGLKALAKLLNVTNVEFVGHVSDMDNLWNNYHALVLPSRGEGLPLSMIEAMSVGRTVIVTDVGGNADYVEDGVTGFIGQPNEQSFEDALERAWQRREEWERIGHYAASVINQKIPVKPEKDFAETLIKITHEL
jgi:glycosyltransferase involved in cell wall biosynthesis